MNNGLVVFDIKDLPESLRQIMMFVVSSGEALIIADQNELLGEGERRRDGNEAVWDLLLVYTAKGEKLLTQKAAWTNSQASDEHRVDVIWGSDGLLVRNWGPGSSYSDIGVCSSRQFRTCFLVPLDHEVIASFA